VSADSRRIPPALDKTADASRYRCRIGRAGPGGAVVAVAMAAGGGAAIPKR
jgi:hypothetical protein